MDVSPSKYQLSIFCDLSKIKPETQLIQSLFLGVVHWNVFPNIVKEINMELSQNVNNPNSLNRIPITVDRMQFISSDRKKKINLLTTRIDIEVLNPISIDNYTLDQFHEDSIKILSSILDILKIDSNRLGLVTTYYNPANPKLSKLQDTSIDMDGQTLYPTEWNQQFTYNKMIKLNKSTEQLNMTAIFGKSGLNLQNFAGVTSDRFELNFDVNTTALNTSYRFKVDDVTLFYHEAFKLVEEFKQKILDLFFKK